MLKNQEHRANLLKLIKMMKIIKEENYAKNKTKFEFSLTDYECTCYIPDDMLMSIRELTRMFIEELQSEYLKCSEGDEIVRFIEDMTEWLQLAYNFIIENKAESSSVKSLKICNQSLNDYKNVYEKANIVTGSKYGAIAKIEKNYFEFGKKHSATFTKDGVRIESGNIKMMDHEGKMLIDITTKDKKEVEFNDTGMTVNDGIISIVSDSEKILNSDFECVKKLNEIYEYIQKQQKILIEIFKEKNLK